MSVTITRKDSGVSLYVFNDGTVLSVTDLNVLVGDPLELVIADCNSNNVLVYEGVEAPLDWRGHRYFFDGTTWTLNPDWIDPRVFAASVL